MTFDLGTQLIMFAFVYFPLGLLLINLYFNQEKKKDRFDQALDQLKKKKEVVS